MRTIKNLIGSILISIAVFVFWAIILPDYDGRVHLQSEIKARSAHFEAKNKLINKTVELDKEYQSRYAELKRLALVVPSEKHLEEMITVVEDIFLTSGVSLTDMALSADEDQSGLPYNLIGMEFAFNATYDSVINFLYAIEKSLRLIDTVSLSLSVNQEEPAGQGQVSLNVLFKARAYFLSESFQYQSKAQNQAIPEE